MYNWELDGIIANSKIRSWEGRIKLICVGRLYRFKNFHSVISGMSEFHLKNPMYEWELNFVGDGECRNSLQTLINDYGLESRINLLGSKPYHEVINIYSQSHVAIMPGRAEGWSKVINESWATGCLPFIINSGNSTYPLKFAPLAGVVYEPTIEDFSQKLLGIFQMSDEQREIIFTEGLKANRNLTLEIYKNNLEELIQNYYVSGEEN
jgi:glycosyltransferase involved in cell wall biosynthesis